MGASPSKYQKLSGISVTMDAFGTLYHPREPIAVQYLRVARTCGLKADIPVSDLESSFRQAFKAQYAKSPNYGKATGMRAEEWWNDVVVDTFRPFLGSDGGDSDLLSRLPPLLWNHFSSSAAYALYPDVEPFLQTMRKLKQRFQDPDGPIVTLGIVTNSDHRVRSICTSLGLRVGPAEWREDLNFLSGGRLREKAQKYAAAAAAKEAQDGIRSSRIFNTLAYDWYDPQNDIDLVVTSYAAGSEKPDLTIFRKADEMILQFPLSRSDQAAATATGSSSSAAGALLTPFRGVSQLMRSFKVARIHVGDDFEKDYQAAKYAGYEALHLDRKLDPAEKKDYQISSLEELATYVNMMVELNLGSPPSTEK